MWRLLAQAIEAEVEAFVTAHKHLRGEEGRNLVIRNGYRPERTIQSGIGDIAIKASNPANMEATQPFDMVGRGYRGHEIRERNQG